MKKIIVPLLLLALLVSPLTVQAFDDVPEDHEYAFAISVLEDAGIIEGYSDGRFGVDESISRAEFLKIAYLAEVYSYKPSNYGIHDIFPFGEEDAIVVNPPCFSDFDSTHWYEPYACWGKEQELVQGYPDGSFKATDAISFAEAAKILVKTSGFYIQTDESYWYRPYVLELNADIPASINQVDQNLTRGEAVELIFRYKMMNEDYPSSKTSNYFYWLDGEAVAFEYLGSTFSYTTYLKKGDQLYYHWQHPYDTDESFDLLKADLETFKIYNPWSQDNYDSDWVGVSTSVATDKFGVFNSWQRIKGSAGGEFIFYPVLMNPDFLTSYASDKEHVYAIMCYELCSVSMLADSDVSSFEFLDHSFARDQNNVYYFDWQLDKTQFDINSFEVVDADLFKDKDGYYSLFKNKGLNTGGNLTPLGPNDFLGGNDFE